MIKENKTLNKFFVWLKSLQTEPDVTVQRYYSVIHVTIEG